MSNETNQSAVEKLYFEMLSFIPPPHRKLCEGLLKQYLEMEKEEHNITWNNAILSFENEIRKVMKEGKL
jgi:hypothetical protein